MIYAFLFTLLPFPFIIIIATFSVISVFREVTPSSEEEYDDEEEEEKKGREEEGSLFLLGLCRREPVLEGNFLLFKEPDSLEREPQSVPLSTLSSNHL